MRCGSSALLLLLAAVLLSWGPVAHAACHVRLDIDGAASTFQFSGTNSLTPSGGGAPLSGAIADDAPATPKGFNGALFADSPSQPACPTTADNWLDALAASDTVISSEVANWYSVVTLYPPVLPGTTLGFPFQPTSISLRVTVQLTKTGAGTFTASLTANITQGWLFSSTTLTGDRWDDVAGLSATATALPGTLSLQGSGAGQALVLDIPALEVTFTTPPATVTVLGQPYNSVASLKLNGRLLLKSVLGCSVACGDKGRCAAAADNATAACECECGWQRDAGGACTVPGGACTRFGASSAVCPANATAPATPPVTAVTPQSVPPNANGTCPDTYAISIDGTECLLCPPGFGGLGCATCQADSGCAAATGSTGATCVRTATYQDKSSAKNYTCGVKDLMVKSLLGDDIAFTCSTRPPANATGSGVSLLPGSGGVSAVSSPVNATPYCTLRFRLSSFSPGGYVKCTGWGCAFAANTTRVECSVIQCDCPNGCTTNSGSDMSPTFKGLSGSIGLSCDDPPSPGATSQACALSLSGLPVDKINLDCSTSECYDAAAGTGGAGMNGG